MSIIAEKTYLPVLMSTSWCAGLAFARLGGLAAADPGLEEKTVRENCEKIKEIREEGRKN